MITEPGPTYWARIYMSGPIDVAKQVLRRLVMEDGLCVTIEPTTFIYTGGEESGYVVGFVHYPRFPSSAERIRERAHSIMLTLLDETYQHSGLLVCPMLTTWVTKRPKA